MTGSTIAYGLRAAHLSDGAEPFLGALIRIGESRDLNVAEALEQGDGRIVVAAEDYVAVNALDAFTALKRLPAEDDDAGALAVSRWDKLLVGPLREALATRSLPTTGNKPELVALLTRHDAAVADGPDAVFALRDELGFGPVDRNDPDNPEA